MYSKDIGVEGNNHQLVSVLQLEIDQQGEVNHWNKLQPTNSLGVGEREEGWEERGRHTERRE